MEETESWFVKLRVGERRYDEESRMTVGVEKVDKLRDVFFDGEI